MSAPLSITSLSHQHSPSSDSLNPVALNVIVVNKPNLYFKNFSHYENPLNPLDDFVKQAIKLPGGNLLVDDPVPSDYLQASAHLVIWKEHSGIQALIKTNPRLKLQKVAPAASIASYLQAMIDCQPENAEDVAMVANANKKKLTPLAAHHGREQVVCHHDVNCDDETDIIAPNNQLASLINRAHMLIRKKEAAIAERLCSTLDFILSRTRRLIEPWLKYRPQSKKIALWILSLLALLIAHELYLQYWQQIIVPEIFIWPLENNEVNPPSSNLFDTKPLLIFK